VLLTQTYGLAIINKIDIEVLVQHENVTLDMNLEVYLQHEKVAHLQKPKVVEYATTKR